MNKKLKDFVIETFEKMAIDLSNNPDGLNFRLNKAREKLNKKSVIEALGVYVDHIKLLIRLIKAWISGRYRKVSYASIIWAIIGVIYFLNPADFIPDLILGLGLIDDIAVIKWVFKNIKNDLEKFKAWEEEQEAKESRP